MIGWENGNILKINNNIGCFSNESFDEVNKSKN